MRQKTVLLERDGDIATLKFNRPHRLNAINGELVRDLIAALRAVKRDRRAKVVIVKGEGRAFCSGDDLKEADRKRSPQQWAEFLDEIQEIGRLFLRLGKPTIAAVRGYAVGGGCEFAMNCDIRIAAEGAKFGFTETSLGAPITTAGTQLLPRLVGMGKAKEMVLVGELIEAREAEKWGLVNKVVPPEELDGAAQEMALKIASNSPLAVRLMRSALDFGPELSFEGALELESIYGYATVAAGETGPRMKARAERIGRKGRGEG